MTACRERTRACAREVPLQSSNKAEVKYIVLVEPSCKMLIQLQCDVSALCLIVNRMLCSLSEGCDVCGCQCGLCRKCRPQLDFVNGRITFLYTSIDRAPEMDSLIICSQAISVTGDMEPRSQRTCSERSRVTISFILHLLFSGFTLDQGSDLFLYLSEIYASTSNSSHQDSVARFNEASLIPKLISNLPLSQLSNPSIDRDLAYKPLRLL